MDIEILISQYIDGDLSSDAEAELHHILSVSPEARGLFRQQIAMRNIARDTRILHAPSVSLQNSLFERLQSEEGLHEAALPTMMSIADSEPVHSIPSDNAQLHRQTTSRRRKLVAVIMPFMFGVVMAGGAWTVYKSFIEKDGSQQIKEQKVLADYAPPAQSAPEMKSDMKAESNAPQVSAIDRPNVASDAVVPRPVAAPPVNPLITRWTKREPNDRSNDFRDKSDDEEGNTVAKDSPGTLKPVPPLASTKSNAPAYQPNVGEASGNSPEMGGGDIGGKGGVARGALASDTMSTPRVPLTRGHNANEKTTLIKVGGGYAGSDDINTEDGSGPATASRKKLDDADVAPASAPSTIPNGNSSPTNLNNDSRALQQNYKTRVQDLSDQYKAAIQEAKSTNIPLGTTTTVPDSKIVVLKAPAKLKKAKAKNAERARKSAAKRK